MKLRRLIRPRSRVLVVIAGSLSLLAASSCDSERTKGCWMGVETLRSTGIVVTDVISAQAAFEAYTAFVDTTAAEFPDGAAAWTFSRAAYDRNFEGVRYWMIWHFSASPAREDSVLRRTIDVDENGNVVQPLGCI